MSDATKKNGMATASLVLGIVSLALCWTGWIALACGIIAIVLAVVAKNKIKADPDLANTSGQATGGLITGIIGSILSLLLIILAIMFVSSVAGDLENFEKSLDEWEELMDR